MKWPIDIIICILFAFLFLITGLFHLEGIISIIFGLLFILFIPGYTMVFVLFPAKKSDESIDVIERIALSLSLSFVIISLIAFGLSFSVWGVTLQPLVTVISTFVIGSGLIAILRWFGVGKDKRFIVSFDIYLPKIQNKINRYLIIILVLSIVIIFSSLIYVLMNPIKGEQFTEFYLLDSHGLIENYPKNLTVGEETSVIIGIVNHEYKTINYTIEVWLINQTVLYNESIEFYKTIFNSMWFCDKINITLKNTPINIEKNWEPQWEYNYSFNLSKKGNYILAFLLFKEPTENYDFNRDYAVIAEKKTNGSYRAVFLSTNIK